MNLFFAGMLTGAVLTRVPFFFGAQIVNGTYRMRHNGYLPMEKNIGRKVR